jgi:hypothetical protein
VQQGPWSVETTGEEARVLVGIESYMAQRLLDSFRRAFREQ